MKRSEELIQNNYNEQEPGIYSKQVGPLLLTWMTGRIDYIDIFVVTSEYNLPFATISGRGLLKKSVEQIEKAILEMYKAIL